MKMVKKSLVLFVLAAVLVASLAGCGGKPGAVKSPDTKNSESASILGKWDDTVDDTAVLEFKNDGTYVYSWLDPDEEELEWTGTYKINGTKTIIMTDDDDPDEEEIGTYVIDGDVLELDGMLAGEYIKVK